MVSLEAQFKVQNILADPQTDAGRSAIQKFQDHLAEMRKRLGSPGGEIPPDVKQTLVSRIDAAKRGMNDAIDDGKITAEERAGLVARGTSLGGTADAIVAAQQRFNPVPPDMYRDIVK